jgi:glycosyltransferase involved in cell wall biosynthesis
LPVASTRIAGVPEMVVDGETGLLVTSGDVAGLTNAMERIAWDQALARRFGTAGYALARRKFALVNTTRELLGLLL